MDVVDIGVWVKSFTAEDIAALISIGVIAAFLRQAKAITEAWALILPLCLGFLVGMLQSYTNGYAPAAFVIKGMVMGGGAGVFGRLVAMGLVKAGILSPPNPPSPSTP